MAVLDLVGGGEVGAEGGGEVFALGRAHAQLGLEVAPGVAGAPVVHDHIAGYVFLGLVCRYIAAGLADDAGDLKFVIDLAGAARVGDIGTGAVDRAGVGVIEDRV